MSVSVKFRGQLNRLMNRKRAAFNKANKLKEAYDQALNELCKIEAEIKNEVDREGCSAQIVSSSSAINQTENKKASNISVKEATEMVLRISKQPLSLREVFETIQVYRPETTYNAVAQMLCNLYAFHGKVIRLESKPYKYEYVK